ATEHELRDARRDVFTGMAFSNVVMYFIILATAATLFRAGHTNIETSREAAEALRPLAGDGAYVLFALGLVGTGLLAIPVLAGSASFAVAELFAWPSGLDLKPTQAWRFYTILGGAIEARHGFAGARRALGTSYGVVKHFGGPLRPSAAGAVAPSSPGDGFRHRRPGGSTARR